jgi:hypothetical protein
MSQDNSETDGAAAAVSSSDELVRYKEDCGLRVREQLVEIAGALTSHGVKRVRATYEGSGDSGCLEDPEYFGAENASIAPEALGELHDKVSEFFYDFIDRRHSGFGENEGGGGEFEWDLTEDGLIHEAFNYITDRDYTTYKGVQG